MFNNEIKYKLKFYYDKTILTETMIIMILLAGTIIHNTLLENMGASILMKTLIIIQQ